jgi:TonB family protein
LKPLSQRPPRFPLALDGKVATGEALIEFLVDEEGRARLPRIKSRSDEAFGYAAMQGVSSWRFEVPTYGGRAAIVRVQVPVTFGARTLP